MRARSGTNIKFVQFKLDGYLGGNITLSELNSPSSDVSVEFFLDG